MTTFRTERFISGDISLVELPQVPSHQQVFNALSLTYEEALSVLDDELSTKALYKKTWQEAVDIFQANPTNYTNQERKQIPDECHIGIIAYTLNTTFRGKTLSRDFNEHLKKLKNDHGSWLSFSYKSLYWFLSHSVNGFRNKPSLSKKAYRGVNFHYDSGSFSFERPVCFNQFTSCTTDSQIADKFEGSIGTVFEFPANVTAGIGISNYSPFPQENEILIFPWNTFMIKEIERIGPVHRIVLQKTKQHEFRDQAQDLVNLVRDNLS